MCFFESDGVPWPPRGWKHFSHIMHSCGQSVSKDPTSALVTGLSYKIDASPISNCGNILTYIYSIQISGWSYSIYNDSTEYPILSYQIFEKRLECPEHSPYMTNLKIKARAVDATDIMSHRAMLASLLLIKQINANAVPDYEQILKLYRIPLFLNKKSADTFMKSRADSLYCGLVDLETEDVDFI